MKLPFIMIEQNGDIKDYEKGVPIRGPFLDISIEVPMKYPNYYVDQAVQ